MTLWKLRRWCWLFHICGGNLSREKTFANFVVFEQVLSAKFLGRAPFRVHFGGVADSMCIISCSTRVQPHLTQRRRQHKDGGCYRVPAHKARAVQEKQPTIRQELSKRSSHQFTKVFTPIHKSFLPRKIPTIWYYLYKMFSKTCRELEELISDLKDWWADDAGVKPISEMPWKGWSQNLEHTQITLLHCLRIRLWRLLIVPRWKDTTVSG